MFLLVIKSVSSIQKLNGSLSNLQVMKTHKTYSYSFNNNKKTIDNFWYLCVDALVTTFRGFIYKEKLNSFGSSGLKVMSNIFLLFCFFKSKREH